MKKMTYFVIFFITLLPIACGGTDDPQTVPEKEVKWQISPTTLSFAAEKENRNLLVKADGRWRVSSTQQWCSVTPAIGYKGDTSLKITVASNPTEEMRTAVLLFSSDSETGNTYEYTITQDAGEVKNYVPEGYSLVWQDEFDEGLQSGGRAALPNAEKWWYETGDHGWGNNEIQNYVPAVSGTDTCAFISDGTLKIVAKEVDGKVLSVRMNTVDSWTYGYFEARLKLPGGKGVWPAFWMMPKNFEVWPDDGEIDIMEYVGFDPNVVHSTVHTKAYNHMIGTQKGKSTRIENAETEFHIYAVEWTASYIKGFVDGDEYFHFSNDNTGDKDTWPFDAPFYLKLNLAWGGNWGGAQGVDRTKLPATYEIDYVRVYRKA